MSSFATVSVLVAPYAFHQAWKAHPAADNLPVAEGPFSTTASEATLTEGEHRKPQRKSWKTNRCHVDNTSSVLGTRHHLTRFLATKLLRPRNSF